MRNEVRPQRSAHARLRRMLLLALIAPAARAEFVYQPQGYGATSRKWRSAGSALFKGVGAVKEGLRLIEEGENEAGSLDVFKQVLENLAASRQRYLELSKEIEKPRPVLFDKLAPSQRAGIAGRFHQAGVRMPKDEREAAALAASEIQRFVDAFRELFERIAQQMRTPQDKRLPGVLLAIAQELKRICDRLEDLGLTTAELLTTLPPG